MPCTVALLGVRGMELRGEITQQDYLRAQWLFMKPRRSFRIAAYILLALYGLLAVLVLATGLAVDEPLHAATFLLSPVAFVPLWYLRRRLLVRMYRRQPSLGGTHAYSLHPDRIMFTSEHATGEARWSVYTKWREDDHLFLIYQGENIFTLLPKRWLDDVPQVADVRRLLSERFGRGID